MEIAIAGWAFHRSILADRTMTLLEFPALARQAYGVSVVELVSEFFPSQTAGYVNRLRRDAIRFTWPTLSADEREGTRRGLAYPRDQVEACGPW